MCGLGYLTGSCQYTNQTLSLSFQRRLSDIFRKGKRQLRRTLRSRTDEEEREPNTSSLPPQTGKIVSEGGASAEDCAGPVIATPTRPKERLQGWIREHAASFLKKWVASEDSNPAFEVVKKLREATQKLDPKSPTCLSALTVSSYK